MFPGRLILGVALVLLGCSLLIASPLLPYWQLRHQDVYGALPNHPKGTMSGHRIPKVAENLSHPWAVFFALSLTGAIAIQLGVYLVRNRGGQKRLFKKVRTI